MTWKFFSMKNCFKCLTLQPLNSFYRHARMSDGHLNKCKTCAKKDASETYQKTPVEKRRSSRRAYSKANPTRVAAWSSKYGKLNAAAYNTRTAARRAKKLSATPLWLSAEQKLEIKEFYTIAKELQWLSNEPLHVDHIIPLQGKDVSGLHVPWNLQILPRSQNVSKSNKVLT